MTTKPIAIAVLFAVAISVLALFPPQQAPASTYKPTLGFKVGAFPGAELGAPGVCADVQTIVNIPGGDGVTGNPNFGTLVNFYPTDWFLANDAAIPNGVKVGTISSTVNVSLASAPCNTSLGVIFDMFDADTDPTDVLPPAQVDYWLNESCGLPSCAPDNRGANAGDPANGMPDYLDATPYFINDLFDPDGAGPTPPVQARSRIAGQAIVAGTQIVLQFVRFDPGDLIPMNGVEKEFGKEMGYPTVIVLNNPIESAGAANPSPIGDFCTPLNSTVTLLGVAQAGYAAGGAGGQNNACNPPANTGIRNTGTHLQRTFSQSWRDIDHVGPEADGIENNMDTCPYSNSSAWNPRIPGGAGTGDTDNDGIPNDCDKTPAVDTNFGDTDFDLFPNRQDGCATIANGAAQDNQADSECQLAGPAWDWGSKCDAINDACDDSDDDGDEDGAGGLAGPGSCNDGLDNDGAEDGAAAGTCKDGIDNGGGDGADRLDANDCKAADYDDADCTAAMDKVDATPGLKEDGHYHQILLSDPVCIAVAGSDTDGDGWCNATEALLGSGAGTTPETFYADEVVIAPGAYNLDNNNPGEGDWAFGQSCGDDVDNNGGGGTDNADARCDRTGGITTDTDGDGWADYVEEYLSTDVMQKCMDGVRPWHDAWPLDIYPDASVDVTGDVFSYVGRIGAGPGTAGWWRRLDIYPDASLDVTGDVFSFVGQVGAGCTPGT